LRTLCIATRTLLVGACLASSAVLAATDPSKDACAVDARQAIATAKETLRNDDTGSDRLALACLVEAVAILDSRLNGLADGSLPFEGQIYAPQGVVMIKPSVQEDR
jgi:hypothetical protein